MYSAQLTGAMATEAALLLITNIQNMTEGLDLGIVTLLFQDDGSCSKSNHDDHKIAIHDQPEILAVIIALSVIIATLLLLLLISAVYLR